MKGATALSRRFEPGEALALESGAALPGLTLAYRTWGTLSPAADNAVVVCHALTGSADADRWWPGLFGPDRALDPDRDFILCINLPGSCYGSTGPADAAPDGAAWGRRFPALSVRDGVRAQRLLLDHLGVAGVRLVLGGSLGGMQALEWAALDSRVAAAAVIAAPGRHEAWAIAWSDTQRRALATDPAWAARPHEAQAGLAAARAIAMLSYRSPASLAQRFGREAGGNESFAVGDWLTHHGRALVERFEPFSYRVLLDLMDTHDVGAGRGGLARALAAITIPVLVLGVDSDQLYPPAEISALAGGLPRGELVWLHSPHGHDAFLIDQPEVELAVRTFRGRLERGTSDDSPGFAAARAAGGAA